MDKHSVVRPLVIAWALLIASHAPADPFRPSRLGESLLDYVPSASLDVKINPETLFVEIEKKSDPRRAVGGVAFIEAAASDFTTVSLLYKKDRPDGSRLTVLGWKGNETHPYTYPAYDWELKPTAEFVASSSNAAVTLFGHLQGPPPAALPAHSYIVSYHPAYKNTLAGLRLLQLDLLLITSDAVYLPGGEDAVRALNEPHSDESVNVRLHEEMEGMVDEIFDGSLWKPVSYIVGDFGSHMRAELLGERVEVTGELTWSIFAYVPAKEPAYWAGQVMSKGTSSDERVYYGANFSSSISKVMKETYGGNPTVYRSASRICRLAAFLRQIKARNPVVFERLLNDLREISLDVVATPTIWSPSHEESPGEAPF